MTRLCLALAAAAALARSADAAAAPSAWVIDDGEKIRQDATSTPYARGEGNPVWRPGEAARLFAMRGESVALQVVVQADDAPLLAATVDVSRLVSSSVSSSISSSVSLSAGPGGPAIAEPKVSAGEAARVVGRPIERFVEWFVPVRRASGGRTPGESLGWSVGAAPAADTWVGPVPDALVPVELAGDAYPMRVAPRSNGIVWIDVNVPVDQPPGMYQGTLAVRDGERPLATIPLELTIADARLPDAPGRALLYYDVGELTQRVGAGAEPQLWKLLHAHRIAPLHDARTAADVSRRRRALDGSLYVPSAGYLGPAQGIGDPVLCLGAYGGLGDPDAATLGALADAVEAAAVPASTSVLLYADDEHCTSPRGAGWSALVRTAGNANVARVRVGWTCADDPGTQPVDIPMLEAGDYDAARAARANGKEVWIYNGEMPHTGTFLLDASAVSPRVNGWIAEMSGIPRWMYWESTYWYGRHGKTPIDPYAEAESFHGDHGDWANGDGVLLYPGRQIDGYAAHSFGVEGVFPSIRLKNWRRGLEDAAYLRLARERDAARADAIAKALVPAALRGSGTPSWSAHGQAFFEARRALLGVAMGPRASAAGKAAPPAARGWVLAPRWFYPAVASAFAGIAFAVGRLATRGRQKKSTGRREGGKV